MPLATMFTLVDDRKIRAKAPRSVLDDKDTFAEQTREAWAVLRALNREISGNPLEPCRQMRVFNHDD